MDQLIGRLLDEKPLDSVTRSLLTIKMDQIKKAGTPEAAEDKGALWKFCDSQFQNFVQLCDNKQMTQAKIIVEKIRLVVLGMSEEKFASKLLTEAYFEMESMYILNTDMTMMLLQHRVIPVQEWDTGICKYI